MSEREHDFVDQDDQHMRIAPSAEQPGTAFLDDRTGRGIYVPAHRLAEFTRALWSAAGQPVPDLPVIYDPEMVEDLARTIAVSEGASDDVVEVHRMLARSVLGAGWRKQ